MTFIQVSLHFASSGACAASEVNFEVTNFFKSLISNPNSIHYGLLISANVTFAEKKLVSVQVNSSESPRVVATYTGSCLTGTSASSLAQERVYYLGSVKGQL